MNGVMLWTCLLTACFDGFFGQNCANECNSKCNGCNNVNGLCERGCDPGWRGDYCGIGQHIFHIQIKYLYLYICWCSLPTFYVVWKCLRKITHLQKQWYKYVYESKNVYILCSNYDCHTGFKRCKNNTVDDNVYSLTQGYSHYGSSMFLQHIPYHSMAFKFHTIAFEFHTINYNFLNSHSS